MHHSNDTDVLIIGGGPAGISAAIWCVELGLRASIFEKEPEAGGQLLRTFNPITNYPGVKTKNGRELRDVFMRSLDASRVSLRLAEEIAAADLAQISLSLADGTQISGKAIIIATGVRRRRLGIPGEVEFAGRGILDSGVASKNEVRGKAVVVIGGGDAALENAMILSKSAARVVVVHRGSEFSARDEFIRKIKNLKNIEILLNTLPTAIAGDAKLEAIELSSLDGKMRRRLETDHLLIRIGSIPNTEMFRGQLELDDKGYIPIDSQCAAHIAGVFAAGDVASPVSPTISNASGQGAAAAKVIHKMVRG